MSGPRMNHDRLSPVLTGVSFPARTWELLAQADYYGADCYTRAALHRLPRGMYHSVASVVTMINEADTARAFYRRSQVGE